jgi:hypothetical protein
MTSVSGVTLATHNIFTRSSTLGRKALDKILAADGNPLDITRIKLKSEFNNTNADILNARLKSIGLRLKFIREEDADNEIIEDIETPLHIDAYTVFDTPLRKPIYVKLFHHFRKYLKSYSFVEDYPGQKEELAWDHVFGLDEIKAMDLDPSIVKACRDLTAITDKDNDTNKPIEEDFEDDEV